MVQVLLAGVISMVISILAGPKFIEFLRRNEFGQQIREEGPQGHVIKQGTPAMGGLLIMLAMSLPFLIFSKHTLPALTAFFVANRRRDFGIDGVAERRCVGEGDAELAGIAADLL